MESSRCGRPRWYRIRVISGEALWELFPVHIGLTWEHDILVLKSSLWNGSPNGNEADDWMGLDELKTWFES
ncbi:hypothetical protein TNCV_3407101 [Trichonephila clavipes]|nr:hypothetical protein TNCV_3407101 [Trichonephila clavipes]